MSANDEPQRMGSRVSARLKDLGWKQVDLVSRIEGLDPATLSALIKRGNRSSKWSDEIAEALGVNHRWLLSGAGPKERSSPPPWPFDPGVVSPAAFARLSDRAKGRIEGYIQRLLEEAAESTDSKPTSAPKVSGGS